MAELLGDARRREQLSGEGRNYAAAWSDERLAGKLAELYRQIVARGIRRNVPDFNYSPL
jgi:hypothetical protein